MAKNSASRGRSAPRQPEVDQGGGQGANDYEVREFLEGLLEGFRAAAAANAAQGNTGPRQPKWFEEDGNRSGQRSVSPELDKTQPRFPGGGNFEPYGEDLQTPSPQRSASPPRAGGYPSPGAAAPRVGGGFASDPLSTMMRRHALRAFLEETSGSVAKAFEQMANVAVKNNFSSQQGIGLPDQRMKYKFAPIELQKTLSQMGYGVGAGAEWWRALFKSLDCDEDGAVSLQDMYDALVLDLPPLPAGSRPAESNNPYYQSPSPNARARGYSPSGGRVGPGQGFERECQMCGSSMGKGEMYCSVCGTAN